MYGSELAQGDTPRDFERSLRRESRPGRPGGGRSATAIDHLLELSHLDRKRIFNLGYFTWVEQQGVSVEEFTARSAPVLLGWAPELVPAWDAMIAEFNARSGAAAALAA